MRKVDVEQGSYEWHCLRQGKVTGTTLKSALGSPKVRQTLLYKLVAERMTEPQIADISSPDVIRGQELEPMARKAVVKKTGIEFTETGMLISDELPDFGISPDSIFEQDGKVVGGLEIKCPGSKKHIEYLIDGNVPKDYFHQVKAPFVMSDDIQWWYFASFDDRNYELPLFIKKVCRKDLEEIEADRTELKSFLSDVEDAHTGLTF